MICSTCNRVAAFGSEVCSGCRTVSRIKFLWTHQLGPPEDGLGLGILRGCAGELTDLAEARSGRLSREAEIQGKSGGQEPKAAPVEAPLQVKREATPGREETPGVAPVVKAEDSKEDKGGEDAYSYIEESEEEEEKEGDPALQRDAQPKDSGKEGSPKPLGLTPIGTKLSRPTPEALDEQKDLSRRREVEGEKHRGRESQGSRIERKSRYDDFQGRSSRGSQRSKPPEPAGPPPGHHDRRERSRTPVVRRRKKKKKSKGVAHRERGREFRARHHGRRS